MPIVTGIRDNRGVMEIDVDGSTALRVRRQHFALCPLRERDEIDVEDYVNRVAAVQFPDAYEAALTSLDRAERTAREIVQCVVDVSNRLRREFPSINVKLSADMAAVTTQELEDMYPDLPDPSDRENAFLRKHKTALIMQIGGRLKSGKPHDGRAPDYDDWALNGDILFWNDVLDRAFEISSMGIRVDAESLDRQLTLAGCEERRALPFHKMLLNDELPLTIGGGIGQSRLCMLMMGNAHIGEVQSSIWDEETLRVCAEKGILLL